MKYDPPLTPALKSDWMPYIQSCSRIADVPVSMNQMKILPSFTYSLMSLQLYMTLYTSVENRIYFEKMLFCASMSTESNVV